MAGHCQDCNSMMAIFRSSTGRAPLECQKSPRNMIPAFLQPPLDYHHLIGNHGSLVTPCNNSIQSKSNLLCFCSTTGKKKRRSDLTKRAFNPVVASPCNCSSVHSLQHLEAHIARASTQVKIREYHPWLWFGPYIGNLQSNIAWPPLKIFLKNRIKKSTEIVSRKNS